MNEDKRVRGASWEGVWQEVKRIMRTLLAKCVLYFLCIKLWKEIFNFLWVICLHYVYPATCPLQVTSPQILVISSLLGFSLSLRCRSCIVDAPFGVGQSQ